MAKIEDIFPNGIREYTKFNINRAVYFPKGYEYCKFCEYCKTDRLYEGRFFCNLTGETLYTDMGIGRLCPLQEEKI